MSLQTFYVQILNSRKFLYGHMTSVRLHRDLGVELLGEMVAPQLTICRASTVFSEHAL